MSKLIKVTINKDGTVLEVLGVTGSSCSLLTLPYAKKMGGIVEQELKSEYYETVGENIKETE